MSATDALSRTTTYGYDAVNRNISAADPLSHWTSYEYDGNGNRTTVTDANNRVTTYGYDARNQLVSVLDAANGLVGYSYDAAGNRKTMTDANGRVTRYGYDELNRVVSTTDPLSNTTQYRYDATGNRDQETKPDGTVVSSTYDALNRLSGMSAPGLSIAHGYDELGNRTVMTDATGTTRFEYDALRRMTLVTNPDSSTVGYRYDELGNRTQLIYPSGSVVTYTYDLLNRMQDVTDWSSAVVSYSYDAAGKLQQVTNPNGTATDYRYDVAGQVTAITHTSEISGTFAFFRYQYDNAGNRLSEVSADGTTSYAYDTLYRLTSVAYPDAEQVTYTYDAMGNRLAMTSTLSGALSYAYDAGDRMLSAGTDTFGWDSSGRMITRTYGLSTAIYSFDPLDRLTQVVSGTGTTAFNYDGANVRRAKSVNDVTTRYTQDLSKEIPVVLAWQSGESEVTQVYGVRAIAAYERPDRGEYYQADALGSIRYLTDGVGRVVDRYAYDSFGAQRSHLGSSNNLLGFAGEELDRETQLINLRSRQYDPVGGRFLQIDPAEGSVMTTQSWNPYIYVTNNPARYADPLGLWGITVLGGVGARASYLGGVSPSAGIGYEAEFESWDPLRVRYEISVATLCLVMYTREHGRV